MSDSYISVIEAVKHAGYTLGLRPEISWLNTDDYDPKIGGVSLKNNLKNLSSCAGLIIPGGFGGRGVEGKINAIRWSRENKKPFLGLCYGMQLAVIEFARNVAGLKDANTKEVNPKTPYPVIDIMPDQKAVLEYKHYGGTMRLGAYPAKITPGTIAYRAYKKTDISERHRHRYEVNPEYIETLKKAGLVFSAVSPDNAFMEIMELPKTRHPFFLASQFHPEFTSRPLTPNPLFLEFVKVASKNS